MKTKLQVQLREKTGSVASRKLRAKGVIPAVVYGAGATPKHLTVVQKDFQKLWREAGETTVLSLDGLDKEKSVLIHDVTVDPIYGMPTHVDFFEVRTDQVVFVDVPLVFENVAPAEKELGGTLIKVMHTISIQALPKDLPHEIVIDISSLVTFDDQILVKDVQLPVGVTADLDPEEVVALVQAPQEEEEESEPADVSAVEVAKKGKDETATEE
jgi:large subunit ribosomal protein L25